MEIIALIMKILGSSGAGAALGWIGGLMNRLVDVKIRTLELGFERDKLRHELDMRDKDAAIMQLELAGKERIASIERDKDIGVASYSALQSSYEHDKSIVAGPKMTAFAKFVRPFVTLSFFLFSHVIIGYVLWLVWYMDVEFTKEFVEELVIYVIGWELFQASLAIGWWFANRPSNTSEPRLPQRVVGAFKK